MTPFQTAFRNAKNAGLKTFEFQGKQYTTKTAEEQGREIGARAAAGSGRGASAGRAASDVDVTYSRPGVIPTGGTPAAPAATGGGMSETGRNVMNTLGAMGGMAGMARGGMTAMQRLAEANRAAAAARVPAPRVEPTFGPELPLLPVRADRIPSFKKGGLVTKPKRRK